MKANAIVQDLYDFKLEQSHFNNRATVNMAAQRPSPILEINPRKVVAVEHPMIIKNIDNGIKTFGHVRPFERVSRDPT